MIESIQEDAIMDKYLEKINLKIEDDIRYEAFDLVDKEILYDTYKKVIYDYKLESYIDKIEQWKNLQNDDKLIYCYKLLRADPSDDFPILRQVDVFQKLVNLDFKKFDYFEVLTCAFFSDKILDDIDLGTNSHTTINIPFHPLIPKKHYEDYIMKLRARSKINSFSIPLQNVDDYLQELLYIWYLHTHKKLNPNEIRKEAYLYTFSDDKTVIRDNIKKLQNLIISKPNLVIVNHQVVEAPQ